MHKHCASRSFPTPHCERVWLISRQESAQATGKLVLAGAAAPVILEAGVAVLALEPVLEPLRLEPVGLDVGVAGSVWMVNWSPEAEEDS